MVETPRIIICCEYFSPNLGDGVIGDCLRQIVRQLSPNTPIYIIDLSSRQDFGSDKPGPSPLSVRRLAQNVTPTEIRRLWNLLKWYLNYDTKFGFPNQEILKSPGLLVVGGGQLLRDVNLNFPIKVNTAVSLARRAGLKIAFEACGVTEYWSIFGRRLFSEVICNQDVVSISTRDENSRQNLIAHLSNRLSSEPRTTVDPAVWAAETYDIQADRTDDLIGLGVASPAVLRKQSKNPHHFRDELVSSFWINLTQRLCQQGHRVALFTNGDKEDHAYLKQIKTELAAFKNEASLQICQRPRTPAELVHQIAQFRVFAAHRLHANIIGFALGIPTVGLVWDDKVRQFGRQTKRGEWFVESDRIEADLVEKLLSEAINSQIDKTVLVQLKSQAMSSVRTTLIRAGYTNLESIHC